MNTEKPDTSCTVLHCAICGRELTPADLREMAGGGLLLCGYCRAQEESCGCADEE